MMFSTSTKCSCANFKSNCRGDMHRRWSGKTVERGVGAWDRKGTREGPPISLQQPPLQPRCGNRLILPTSLVFFLCWLAMLAWLAFS